MDQQQIKRIARGLTDVEKSRLGKFRQAIDRELPDLQARDQMRKDARDEATLSGEQSMAANFRWR